MRRQLTQEQLLASRVGFKPPQSSVGGGKDGPGVRPTALGSFCLLSRKKTLFRKTVCVPRAIDFSSAVSRLMLHGRFVATTSGSFEYARMVFSVFSFARPIKWNCSLALSRISLSTLSSHANTFC